jgi:hypothetical protein
MYVHLHSGRKLMGWAVVLLAMVPSALCFEPSTSVRKTLSDVTGRLTYAGEPLHGMTLCLDSVPGNHCAFATLQADGSFRLLNMDEGDSGVVPGRYRAHLYTNPHGSTLPARYSDPRTSGLEIEVPSDWSELNIDLHCITAGSPCRGGDTDSARTVRSPVCSFVVAGLLEWNMVRLCTSHIRLRG